MSIFETAILILYEDKINIINKIDGLNYHINYFLKMSKKDKRLKSILKNYDVTYLKENPSEVLNTIIRSLNKEGAAVLFSMTPQTTMPTNAFTLCLPEKLNDYQIKVLNSISSEEIEFFDIAVLNNEYDSILSDNDFGRTNGYVLDEYLKNLQRGRI